MIAEIETKNGVIKVDLSKPIDLSIPMNGNEEMASAWSVQQTKIEPVIMGDWIGSVGAGASVNFNNISFNPHGNGTHTECIGHITKEFYSINQNLKQYFFTARIITVTPVSQNDDLIIDINQIEKALGAGLPEAIIIRTMPNPESKKHYNYSNSNPPYLSEAAALFIREKGIQHLLIDLPSVDKEKDEGRLLAHKAFWDLNGTPRMNATITEFIYVPDQIKDGDYLLNLQFAAFENDASPSRPVVFEIIG